MASASVFTPNAIALITGAASGVGLAVAKLCRSHGMKLALVDNNKEYLQKAKQSFASEDVEGYELDVSKIEEWASLRDKVKSRFGEVNFLMLNAGIGLKGTWGDTDYFHKV